MRHSPRLFSIIVVLGTCCWQIAASAAKESPFGYDIVNVAPNVYAFVESDIHSIVSGTVTAIIGEDSVLIFDTTHRASSAKSIIADLKRLTKKPVRFVINSHWHEDHWSGNGEFSAAYPNAIFYSHPFTARIIEQRRESFRGEHCKEELRAELGPVTKQLESGKRGDGAAISAAGIAFRKQMIDELLSQIGECDVMRYRGVDVTFEKQITFSLGGRSVHVRHIGRGNTAGDVIAYLPESKVLLTGDLVVAPFPFATQSYIREWADVLDVLLTMEAETIVPGHGKVMHDKTYVTDLAALLRSISNQVHAIYRDGMSVDAVREKIDIRAFRDKFAGSDSFVGGNFDYMLMQLAVERAVQEEQGALKPEG